MTEFLPTPQGIYECCLSRFPMPVTAQTASGWLLLYKEYGCQPLDLLRIAGLAKTWRDFQTTIHRRLGEVEGTGAEESFGKLACAFFDEWAKNYPDDPGGCGPALLDYIQNKRWKDV